jgi:repressor LexA
MTPKMRETLLLLQRTIDATGVAPSFDEMAAELGLASKSGVHRLLEALTARGHIARLPGKARAIVIVRRVPDEAAADQARAHYRAALERIAAGEGGADIARETLAAWP